jgi:hypothetical protein
MKNFKEDFYKFKDKIANHQPFALSRCNDGEMIILFNEFIDIRNKCNGEFVYNPNIPDHARYREKLYESAEHKADNYFVGIACRCCVGADKHEKLKKLTGLDDEHLTWGNIMVNSNYPLFVKEMLPLYNNYDVIVVVNYKAEIKNLPFYNKIIKDFRVGTNAWMNDYYLIDEIKDYITKNDIKDKLFLFCAGPFSNILILEAFKSSPNNTYIDQGSCLDSMMNLGATRGYLWGANTLQQTCIW